MKLPTVSGMDAVKIFEKFGYSMVRQRGSHIRMKHLEDHSRKPLTIPDHPVLGKGLLRKIIRDAEISTEEIMELLR